MKINAFILLLASTIMMVACGEQSGASSDTGDQASADQPSAESPRQEQTPHKPYTKSYDAGSYSFNVNAQNGETSQVTLTTTGLPNEFSESFQIEGQVIRSAMTDLNEDGYKEFVLTIRPTDDSGNVDLRVFASNNDKSISMVTVSEPELVRDVNTDQLVVSAGRIERTFKSAGTSYRYSYDLKQGEAGYQLVAKQMRQ